MKHTLLALLCTISLMAVASPIFESKAVHTQKGSAYLDRQGTEPIRDDFTEGLSKWTVVNYENLLTFKTGGYSSGEYDGLITFQCGDHCRDVDSD